VITSMSQNRCWLWFSGLLLPHLWSYVLADRFTSLVVRER
jgi:hypothetical protein